MKSREGERQIIDGDDVQGLKADNKRLADDTFPRAPISNQG